MLVCDEQFLSKLIILIVVILMMHMQKCPVHSHIHCLIHA